MTSELSYQRLGSFEILDRLGAGAMGEVYRARDTKLGREVAIKVLPEVFAQEIPDNSDLVAEIEEGHDSALLCHLGNIAIRTGAMLHFDPAKERMVENAKADKLVRRKYREHWGTPKGV